MAVWYFIIYPSSLTRGNGNLTTEKRNLTQFVKLNVGDRIKVNITQGTEDENLEIKAEDNIIKNIKTEVKGDTLYINFEKYGLFALDTISPTKDVNINLKYKDLQNIDLSGEITLMTTNKIRTENLIMNLSGVSTVTSELFVNSLNLNSSGSGTIQLTGSAAKVDLKITGSGNLDSKDLDSKDVKVDISGVGNAKLRADDSLDVNVTGAGSLEYVGNPKKITQNITGTGTVKQSDN